MITHLSVLAKKFYAGCPSCRNPPHLSGLGTGIKRHRNVPPMAGLMIWLLALMTKYVGRKMMEMELPGKRRRGKPKRRFLAVVKEDMGKLVRRRLMVKTERCGE